MIQSFNQLVDTENSRRQASKKLMSVSDNDNRLFAYVVTDFAV